MSPRSWGVLHKGPPGIRQVSASGSAGQGGASHKEGEEEGWQLTRGSWGPQDRYLGTRLKLLKNLPTLGRFASTGRTGFPLFRRIVLSLARRSIPEEEASCSPLAADARKSAGSRRKHVAGDERYQRRCEFFKPLEPMEI